MDTEFELYINDSLKQRAVGSDMMMYPVDLLVYVSQFFPLKAGDIIYTGTPAGVTSIAKGSTAELMWGAYSYRVRWV